MIKSVGWILRFYYNLPASFALYQSFQYVFRHIFLFFENVHSMYCLVTAEESGFIKT
ncbi:MAG: hypothetical protein ACTTJ1_03285 [Treponema sp.]